MLKGDRRVGFNQLFKIGEGCPGGPAVKLCFPLQGHEIDPWSEKCRMPKAEPKRKERWGQGGGGIKDKDGKERQKPIKKGESSICFYFLTV